MLTKVKNVLDITADTVADLANVQHKTGSIQLLGFHTKGDGGGGVFYWDATKDKSEHNGGTIIDPSIAGLVANWEYTQNLYFSPAVIGQGCWVREYSGAVDVKWFGAKGDGVADDTAAIQAALDSGHRSVYIPEGTYNISAALFPKSSQRVVFLGGKIATTKIIPVDECAIKLANVSDVVIEGADINCNNHAANSGIIVRENTSNIEIYKTRVVNAAWDATRGGGRGIIIEANTGTQGRIIVDNLIATNVDTVIGVQGFTGMRKNAVIVSNIVGVNATKLIAVFGNGAGYPHSGDVQQCIISNAVGYEVTQPVRFDRASNVTISNVYVCNENATDSFVRGTASNVRMINSTLEGDLNSLYDATPWDDSNSSHDFGENTQDCHFDLTNKGTLALAAVSSGLTRATIISNSTLNLNVDTITTNLVGTTQVQGCTTALVSLYSKEHNCKIENFLSVFGGRTITGSANSASFRDSFTPVVKGSTSAGVGTYSVQFGEYSVIGNRVFFDIYLTWSAHTGTGNLIVSDLPYYAKNQPNGNYPISLDFTNGLALTAGNVIMGRVQSNKKDIAFTQIPSGGGAAAVVPIDTAASIMISGNYPI
jgi:hypothetical protein